jgi:Spy/CpxP family protein refolding chaperone
MTRSRIKTVALWLTPLAFLAQFPGSTGAFAQSVGPDEIVDAGSGPTKQLALTEAQKAAIYKAVLQHRSRRTAGISNTVPAAVGAPVSPAAELADLPDQAAAQASVDDRFATDLKYAMVEGDLVVVDSVSMRVVDVIHGNARP